MMPAVLVVLVLTPLVARIVGGVFPVPFPGVAMRLVVAVLVVLLPRVSGRLGRSVFGVLVAFRRLLVGSVGIGGGGRFGLRATAQPPHRDEGRQGRGNQIRANLHIPLLGSELRISR